MAWKSINVTAKDKDISSKILRSMLAEGRLPGFYSGVKFLVDGDALDEILRAESLKSVRPTGKVDKQ